MRGKSEIIEIVISEIDLYIINRVRKIRVDKGISQLKLSIALGLSEGAVAKIENPRERAKYNIRHINLLAKALHCNIADLIPSKPLKGDLIKAKVRIIKNNKDKRGEPNFEIVSQTPLKD